jgi:hypothetical protein
LKGTVVLLFTSYWRRNGPVKKHGFLQNFPLDS